MKNSFHNKHWIQVVLALLMIIAVGSVGAGEAKADETPLPTNINNIAIVSVSKYEQNITLVNKVTPEEVLDKIQKKDTFTLFVGYKECKYCRTFSIELSQFRKKSKLEINYLDLDETTNKHAVPVLINFMRNESELDGTLTIVLIRQRKVNQDLNYSDYGLTLQDLEKLIPYSNDSRGGVLNE